MLGNQVTSKQIRILTTVTWQHLMQQLHKSAEWEEQKWAKYVKDTYWVREINLLLCIRQVIYS